MSVRIRVLLALFCGLAAATLTVGLVAALGWPLWQENGVSLCVATNLQWAPQIASDGSGGAIVTWEDHRGSDEDIYIQRVDADGNALWDTDGVSLCAATDGQYFPHIAADGSGGAIVTWTDGREYITTGNDIYAQRVDQDGNALWDTDGVSLCVAAAWQIDPQIVSDGSGGAIVTWEDWRSGGYPDIYARRVDGNGNVLWQADGVSLCVATGNQKDPKIASDGSGGAIVTWTDRRSGSYADIYAQQVDVAGNALWDTDGVSLCVASENQFGLQVVSDGSGGAIVTWLDDRDYSTSVFDIYAQRVDGDGNALWDADGVSLCVATGEQWSPQIASDGSGGAIVAWMDYRSGGGYYDIYARRVDSNGNALWDTDGVSLCVASSHQKYPQIASDGLGGAIVTWVDQRSLTPNGGGHIYAQRVDGAGNTLWDTGGVNLCVATDHQYSPQIASDGMWGAIVTWYDYRGSDADIYAQRVGARGIYLPLVMRRYHR